MKSRGFFLEGVSIYWACNRIWEMEYKMQGGLGEDYGLGVSQNGNDRVINREPKGRDS